MPLVPDSIVSAWYSRSSWVYRHFSYLFVNPLWKAKVPGGFSLCPYFWCALFSLLIFRPFVVAFLIVRKVGRALLPKRAIRWTDSKVNALFKNPDGVPLGIPTLLGALLLTMAGIVVICGCALIYSIYVDYSEAGALPLLGLPVLLASVLAACVIYRTRLEHLNRYNSAEIECKPEVYVRITAIGAVVAALFIDAPAFVYVISGISHEIWGAMTEVAAFFLWVITGTGGVLVDVVKWFGLMLLAALAFWPIALAALVVIAIAGRLAMRFEIAESNESAPDSEPKSKELTPEEVRRIALNKVGMSAWGALPGGGVDKRGQAFARHSSIVAQWLDKVIDPSWTKLDADDIRYKLVCNDEYANVLNKVLDEFRKTEEARNAARLARAARCARVTNAINRVLTPIGRAIAWPFKQGAILTVYLWHLAKARKQGACPYLLFKD